MKPGLEKEKPLSEDLGLTGRASDGRDAHQALTKRFFVPIKTPGVTPTR
jgi:hypothetical protein